jgi:hypothetical protein
MRRPGRCGLASVVSDQESEADMPIYMIERNFAERLELSDDSVRSLGEVNAREHVSWLMSFLSADRRKSYCLYEADSAEAIIRAARAAGVPADVVVEVSSRVLPDGSFTEVV